MLDSTVTLEALKRRLEIAAVTASCIAAAGVTIVTDTCTYLAPIMAPIVGAVMTNSAKWAWYGPNNLGIQVIFGSLEECVESAVRGERWRDAELWRDAHR